MSLKIGIDGRALEGQRAGTGRYVYELCKQLATLMPTAEFFVYSSKPVDPPVVLPNWHYRTEPSSRMAKLKSILWLKLRAGRLIERDQLDVFWANASFLPKLSSKTKVVTTVHDLAYLLVPKTMKTVTFIAFKMFFERDVRKADTVISNSQGTAARLVEHLGIKSNGIVRPAVSDHFRPVSQASVNGCLSKYNIDRPYALAVGTLEPRKNLEGTIKDFVALSNNGVLGNLLLVLVGARGWKTSKLASIIHDAEKNNQVKALGFVEDADLPALYTGSQAFLFPSIYEGFGMPVLEARECGANVFAYDLPEVSEAGGPHAHYIPIGKSLVEAMHAEAHDKKKFNDELNAVDRPTWQKEAEYLAKALREDT